MPSLNASVIGSPGYAKQLGKKSGETDVTFYDLKKSETVVTMVEPSRYPEKIQSLYYSAAFGEHAVLVAEKIRPVLRREPPHDQRLWRKGGHDSAP